MTRKAKLLLLIPALWACLFDIVITIVYQPQEYWSGHLHSAKEGNPIGSFFMGNHVSGIFIISVIWLLAVGAIGYFLRPKLARVFLLFVLMAHSFGGSTWLVLIKNGFWYAIVFIAFNSVLFYVIEDRVKRNSPKIEVV